MNCTENMIESRFLLGSHVKDLRKEQQLTQTQLGLMTGLDRSYISRVERGRCNITLSSIMLIANALGVSPSDLLDGVGIPLSSNNAPLPIELNLPHDVFSRR